MSYDIRLFKLTCGDMVIAKHLPEENTIKDVALLQTIPTQQGVQMVLLPYGYPFETEISGEIDVKHILYEYKNFPEELKTKYLEASSNLTLSTPGDMRNLGLGGPGEVGPGKVDFSKLFKK